MNSQDNQESKHSKSPLDLAYHDVEQLQRFVTESGKILPRRQTRLPAKAQRHVTKMIKRARSMLLMK